MFLGCLVAGTLLFGSTQAKPSLNVVDNFRLTDQNYLSTELYTMKDVKAVVIITNGDSTFNSLLNTYKDKSVEFLSLDSNGSGGINSIQILQDSDQLVGESLGVTRQNEVFVIDTKTWNITYRGGLSKRTSDAIDSILTNSPRFISGPVSQGSRISFTNKNAKDQISYSKDIAPIIREKCAECHQPDGIGPMPLNNYTQIRGASRTIREVIRTQRMPPWAADPRIGHFDGDKSLTNKQKQDIVHWIEAGSPRGAGSDPLEGIVFQAQEWPLGKPDLVLDIPAYTIPANGIVDYQYPYTVNPSTEGHWIRASTIKVGDRQAVHHVLTGYMPQVPTNNRGNLGGASVGGYAVGSESTLQPNNIGVYLPPGGAIGFQNHYTPYGRETVERSKIAFYFYKDTPELMMRNSVIANTRIKIQPNQQRHKEAAYITFPHKAILYSAFPHAHYRGDSTQLWLRTPDGKEINLLTLPHYNFGWQRDYYFRDPIDIPAGSMLIARYTFDNSTRNPANPDPNRVVPWGDQSFDEMLYTAIRYRWIDETATKQLPQYDRQMVRGMGEPPRT